MKDIYTMAFDGDSAEAIAKKLKLDVATVKKVLGEMNESTFPFTKRAFKNNEKDNEHTKNALELAKMYGTYDEFKKMKQITAFLDQRGYINKPMYDIQTAITRKYYPRLREEVELKEFNPNFGKDTSAGRTKETHADNKKTKDEDRIKSLENEIQRLKLELENEKNATVKPEPNPDTGEVPLTVGIAHKYLKDKQEKEKVKKEELEEAVIAGRDYKYDGIGPIKISKKMYAKVQRDSKGKDFSGKPYMLALNPKTQETEMVPVKFEEVDITEEEKKCPRCGTINKVPFDKCSNCGLPHDEFATYKAEEVDLDEDIKGFKPHVGPRDTLSYHLPKQKKSMKAFFDLVSKHPKVKNVKQETLRGRGGTVSKIDYDTDKNTQAALMRELDKLEKKFGEYAGQTNVVEEVDNSLMAQATRVISHTSIREKIDPADIDIRATDADRKAADKNIIIQLRRAQDMVKQTGRQDQTGIEFLDRKKQKVDSKIINKALDMFDKMKPNDKAKMQKTIGKSYRDLLKTVQRGRV
jgi:hypothetical protein